MATTLERAGHRALPLSTYVLACDSARRFLGNIADCPVPFDPDVKFTRDNARRRQFPNYEYAAFLRHHGFPSPLLDWTASPFVAAFFAFRKIACEVESVRIYGYRSDLGQGRGGLGRRAIIVPLGPFASIHERHFTQQCSYTWCYYEEDDAFVICPHEDGFRDSRERAIREQDVITTWDIAASERETVLADLYQMNITPFSLFRSLDAAVETASLRILPMSK